jgi:hypothetical protein
MNVLTIGRSFAVHPAQRFCAPVVRQGHQTTLTLG